MDEVKNCKNCDNYMQHFTRSSSRTYIFEIECGHCGAKILRSKEKIQFPEITNCKLWQPKTPPENKIKHEINVLLNLAQRLNDVLVLIEEDLKKLPPE